MAKLSDETLTTVFNLQKQFLESIDAATATEFIIFERFGGLVLYHFYRRSRRDLAEGERASS